MDAHSFYLLGLNTLVEPVVDNGRLSAETSLYQHQKQKPLSAPGREWRAALRAGNSSTGSTKR
ncbi:hypothetical protein CASFOL_009524 [Castilleja foliolosa]|uniref:Uncharacterized protein n=1 Tax=Castilleja foliolosa TaxID=1961234 RepID=A0ABD3DWW6_9LAMI